METNIQNNESSYINLGNIENNIISYLSTAESGIDSINSPSKYIYFLDKKMENTYSFNLDIKSVSDEKLLFDL